jgi:3-oxosteroid 1-dehydrogenase
MMAESFDLVVVGGGGGGLTAAIRAHDLGLKVVVAETLDKLGGGTAYSGGQVWIGCNHVMRAHGIQDRLEEVKSYVIEIGGADSGIDEEQLDQWLAAAPQMAQYMEDAGAMRWEMIPDYPDYYFPEAAGSKTEGRYLSAAPFCGSELGASREKLLYSPHFPVGISYREQFELANDLPSMFELITSRQKSDVLSYGTGIAGHLVLAAAEREIPVLLRHRCVELIREGAAVAGAVFEAPTGRVELRGAVVLATGGYDWNPDLLQKYSGLAGDDVGSVGPTSLRGDGIELAASMGADIVFTDPWWSIHMPGYLASEPDGADGGFRFVDVSLPHSFIVNRAGERFCDDAFYRSVGLNALPRNEVGEQPNLPLYMIWDDQHHQKYGLLPAAGPGQDYPTHLGIESANTLEELATRLGIEPANLLATALNFNASVMSSGHDDAFHRGERELVRRKFGDRNHKPSPISGEVEKAPFHGMRLRLVLANNAAAGVRTGVHGLAIDPSGSPIPGLYAIGTAAASRTTGGIGYNSGYGISRTMTFGYLCAEHVAAQADAAGTRVPDVHRVSTWRS